MREIRVRTTRQITVRFVGEQNYVVRNKVGEIVEGAPREVKKSRDIWTFARDTRSRDPNWKLIATESEQ